MSRLIGLDHGARRIGVAIGDTETRMAFAREAIQRSSLVRDVERIGELWTAESAELVVIGLPLNMDGSEGDEAARARSFGDDARVGGHADCVRRRATDLVGGRPSGCAPAGERPSRQSGELDSTAARLILQQYLDALASSAEPRCPSRRGDRMTRRPAPSEYEQRRNARIRELREQREGPMRRRRRVQPLLLVMWIVGTIGLLVAVIIFGFNAFFAPRVMAWVEENPGAIENGIVEDFVRWYQPEVLADEPASDEQQRITVGHRAGRDRRRSIGTLLREQGLIASEIAFQYAVITSGREGTLPFGTFDLSPTLRPSEIVAALQGSRVRPDHDGHASARACGSRRSSPRSPRAR